MSLAAVIPGLEIHNRPQQSRAPLYVERDARVCVEKLFDWMEDSVPENLLEWLQINNQEQFEKVMIPWRKLNEQEINKDLPGIKASCSAMVVAMQQGICMYNAQPVSGSVQEGLF